MAARVLQGEKVDMLVWPSHFRKYSRRSKISLDKDTTLIVFLAVNVKELSGFTSHVAK